MVDIFADIFKIILFKENFCVLIKSSFYIVAYDIDSKLALIQVMNIFVTNKQQAMTKFFYAILIRNSMGNVLESHLSRTNPSIS